MKRETIAKRSPLAAALNRGRADDAPAEVTEVTPKKETASAKPKRFHTSLYPDPDVYANIRIALIREGQGRDFNQLVNELLAEWLEANGEG